MPDTKAVKIRIHGQVQGVFFRVWVKESADRIGIWVVHPDGVEEKIAAIGVRVRKWITYHGLSINVHPDLSHYDGIIPCGISEHGVTSLKGLGHNVSLADVDAALKKTFPDIF